ncbi:DgyrCDS5064 [Dimorphilus gyrociliatus]|uniref:DgyrCDS5064 n=1 Tax=Dimorphilus gyrociliatus TaxID=2664684 RepID=A0A7I8VIV3_9ANNE|nr:DgyrCDS5064 [Dimorphilus gyrociliatus]
METVVEKVRSPTKDDMLNMIRGTLIIDFITLICFIFKSICLGLFRYFFQPLPLKNVSDDIVLITGAGHAISREIAVEIAKHRPKLIILWGRGREALASTCSAIELYGVDCIYQICDITHQERVFLKAQDIQDTHGSVTILVYNCGVNCCQSYFNIDESETDKSLEFNLMDHCWILQAFLPAMVEAQRGHLVNINSMLGLMSLSAASEYCSSQLCGLTFNEALAYQLKNSNIFITSVHSYAVDESVASGKPSYGF